MVTSSHVLPDASPAFGCNVAILDSGTLTIEEYGNHLSVNERETYARLSTPGQRTRWMAGRLAAKYLFLSSPGRARLQRKPTLSHLSSEALRVFSPWLYRQIEVVVMVGGKPGLSWCGEARAESISLSHSNGVSCACLGMDASVGVDIETTVSRLDAFYRQNFTAAERSWATSNSIRSDWLFTLLWSLKESALKLSLPTQAAGVWDIPKIEITCLPAPEQIGKFWSGKAIDEEFAVFNARVEAASRSLPVRVAVNGKDNFVLAVMNTLEGVVQ